MKAIIPIALIAWTLFVGHLYYSAHQFETACLENGGEVMGTYCSTLIDGKYEITSW